MDAAKPTRNRARQSTPMTDLQRRQIRWRCFQIAFAIMYAGIVLDVITTSLGYGRQGASYEQNPLGGGLIEHLGWIGLLAVLTALCTIAYVSSRTVCRRMSVRWSAILNLVILPIMVFRWLAVITAVAYLVHSAG